MRQSIDEIVKEISAQVEHISDKTEATLRRGLTALVTASEVIADSGHDLSTIKSTEFGKLAQANLERAEPDECSKAITETGGNLRVCPCFLYFSYGPFDGAAGFRGLMTRYLVEVLKGPGSATNAVLLTLDWQTNTFMTFWQPILNSIRMAGREVVVVQYHWTSARYLVQYPSESDLKLVGGRPPSQ